MNEQEIRMHLISIMDEVNISQFSNESLEKFASKAEWNPTFEELDMDSLASMELCISIELEWGVSIVPEQLFQLKTLNSLIQKIKEDIV